MKNLIIETKITNVNELVNLIHEKYDILKQKIAGVEFLETLYTNSTPENNFINSLDVADFAAFFIDISIPANKELYELEKSNYDTTTYTSDYADIVVINEFPLITIEIPNLVIIPYKTKKLKQATVFATQQKEIDFLQNKLSELEK
jgi:hypothetical protein